jgi:hypothetical protein
VTSQGRFIENRFDFPDFFAPQCVSLCSKIISAVPLSMVDRMIDDLRSGIHVTREEELAFLPDV